MKTTRADPGDDLRGHRIATVQLVDLVTRYPRTIGRNAVLGPHGSGPTAPAVVLRTTDGAGGWGHICGRTGNPGRLVGRWVDELFDPGRGVIDDSALWADIALHDLAGVLTKRPVYRMLGKGDETRVAVYDASIYFDDLDPDHKPRGIDAVLQNVEEGWNEGHRSFKLKIGRGCTWMGQEEGLERDVEVTRAVREAFPSARLLVDGNNGFTVDGSLRYLERVVDVGLFWIEEPFHEHREGLERLRSWLEANSPETKIADGEHRPVVDDVLELAREGLLDVLLLDVLDFGLTPWRRLSASLQGSPALASPHAWGLPLKTLYAAHLAAGLQGFTLVEAVPGVAVGIDTRGYRVEEGTLTIPETPGFGVSFAGDYSWS